MKKKRTFMLGILSLLTVGIFAVSSAETSKAETEEPKAETADPRPPYALAQSELEAKLKISPNSSVSEDFLRVVYFHRTPGCATCQKMAKLVFQTVKEDFSEEAQKRKLVIRYVNFEEPKFAPLVQALNVRSPSLFLIEVQGGKDVRAWNLNQIWSLSGNENAFRTYVGHEIRSHLK